MFTEEDIIQAINNDNYTALRRMANETEDLDEAAQLREESDVAFNRVWDHDMRVDNAL